MGETHWLVLSTVFCPAGTILLYDPLMKKDINPYIIKFAKQLLPVQLTNLMLCQKLRSRTSFLADHSPNKYMLCSRCKVSIAAVISKVLWKVWTENKFLVGSSVVISLLDTLPAGGNYRLYCDIYFTSTELLEFCTSRGV